MKKKSLVTYLGKLYIVNDFSDDGELVLIDDYFWDDVKSIVKYCKLVSKSELTLIKK